MHIDRIELFHVAMPLIYPWRTAYGEDAAIHSVLCRMTSGSLAGWGESVAAGRAVLQPRMGRRRVRRRQGVARAGARRAGRSPAATSCKQRLAHFKGNPFAKAALDTAWWGLQSQATGRPLHVLLAEAAGCDRATRCPSAPTSA